MDVIKSFLYNPPTAMAPNARVARERSHSMSEASGYGGNVTADQVPFLPWATISQVLPVLDRVKMARLMSVSEEEHPTLKTPLGTPLTIQLPSSPCSPIVNGTTTLLTPVSARSLSGGGGGNPFNFGVRRPSVSFDQSSTSAAKPLTNDRRATVNDDAGTRPEVIAPRRRRWSTVSYNQTSRIDSVNEEHLHDLCATTLQC